MKIWVDGDACPKAIKDILFKAAMKREVQLELVANQIIPMPKSPFLTMKKVGSGFDVADNYIVEQAQANDLVITADVPLASQVVEKGAVAIEPRGKELNKETIAYRLANRNLMEQLRDMGQISGGPKSHSGNDSQLFANTFDRLLTKAMTRAKKKPPTS